MVRLSREESRAVTRDKLLAAATALFGRDGYALTSVDRIADEAGFSKGAVYSNFESKDAVFLAVLERQGSLGLDAVIDRIEDADVLDQVRAALIDWANERSRHGCWSLAILEHARLAGPDALSVRRQTDIIRAHWRRLGAAVAPWLPAADRSPETFGALLHEVAYAPTPTFTAVPTAGMLMDLLMRSIPGRERRVSGTISSEPVHRRKEQLR